MAIIDFDKQLTKKFNDYIDIACKIGLVALGAIESYLKGRMEDFEESVVRVKVMETESDVLRRDAESHLYSEALIPENRGDLLGLIESADDIIDQIRKVIVNFSVELPYIPPESSMDYYNLAHVCMSAMDEVLVCFRLFFHCPDKVSDELSRTYSLEKIADKESAKIIKKVFSTQNLNLSQKTHLRYFAHNIDLIADRAEDLADRLAIAAIKQIQ